MVRPRPRRWCRGCPRRRLDTVTSLTEILRSRTHEADNRLHAVISLIEIGRADEAVDFATAELEVAQCLADRVTASVIGGFERGWSTKRGDGMLGRGLGLALVGQAARRYGGRVALGRSDLGGAAFRVVVPGVTR